MPQLPGAPNLKNMKFLLEDERFKFALYELNKLNGIAEVTPKSIKFYNGDEYVNESLINNFDEDFFETEIKGKLTEEYLRNGKRTFLKFGDGST